MLEGILFKGSGSNYQAMIPTLAHALIEGMFYSNKSQLGQKLQTFDSQFESNPLSTVQFVRKIITCVCVFVARSSKL